MGIITFSIVCYAAVRTWKKVNRQSEQPQRPNEPVVDDEPEEFPYGEPVVDDEPEELPYGEPVVDDEPEDADEIPDGQLCVICVTRRRVPAFIPCGHLVCCRLCASTVERKLNPKCPVCQQSIRGSMPVYQ